MRWLDVPRGLFTALVDLVPKFEAEDSLTRAMEISLGVGTMDKESRTKVLRTLRRAVDGPGASTLPNQLAGLGIPIVKVPRG
jgi:hypothetical protein